MAISRTSLVRGPAKLTFNGASIFTKDDFEIKIDKQTLRINTSAHGKVDERAIEIRAEASFVPEGRWLSALLNGIFNPFANATVGQSILNVKNTAPFFNTGGSVVDVPFTASGADGEIHRIPAACVTKLPDLYLSAGRTMLGQMTVTGYRVLGTDWTDDSSLYTVTPSGGSVVDATFTPGSIIVQPYLASWGSIAGFTDFDTENGWTISFELETKEIPIDSQGNLDRAFVSLGIMAKCTPVGPTSTQILAAAQIQGGLPRGYSLQNDGGGGVIPDLEITGHDGSTIITVSAANLKTEGFAFGATKLRAGEVGFVATRKFSAGVQQPLFSLASAS